MILSTFQGCKEKCVCFGRDLGHFKTLNGALGVKYVRHGLPGYGKDWMKQQVGSG